MLANSSTFSTSPAEVFQIIRLIVMTGIFYSQLVVDSWASFARNHGMIPESGGSEHAREIEKAGELVRAENLTTRVL
jgi:hypothetical protein